MAAVILKIGNADLSDITEQDGVQINTAPVFGDSFVNVKGQTVRKLLGVSVNISADFELVPQDTAARIVSACSAEKVTIEYLTPLADSAEFERPSVTAVPSFEDSSGVMYWSLSVNASCPLKGDGL